MAAPAKTAMVTGAAGGIGRAVAERLARGGWNVVAADRDGAQLRWTENSPGVRAVVADISQETGNTAIVTEAEEHFGRLDAAILNAGVDAMGSIDDLPLGELRRLIDVNVIGTILGIRATVPSFRRIGAGAIVLTSSTMGIGGDTGNWAYSATKHALTGLVYSLARELGGDGIRINAVAPGLTRGTGMTSMIEEAAPDTFAALALCSPLRRWAEPDEIASVIEFLASSASSYVNGVVLAADGGAITGTGLLSPRAA